MADYAVKNWNEVKSQYQGIKEADYLAKLKEGEFNRFLKDPQFNEDVNSKKLFETSTPQSPETSPAPVAPAEPQPEPVGEPRPGGDAVDIPVWKQKGFESEQAMWDDYQDKIDKKQAQIDEFNAERGQLGQELNKKLKAKETEHLKTMEELNKLKKEALKNQSAVDLPVMPTMPVPEDGDYSNPDYLQKKKNYDSEMIGWQKNMGQQFSTLREDSLKKDQVIGELKQQVTKVDQFVTDQSKMTQTQKEDMALNNLIQEVDVFQDKYPEFKTSKPFSDFNKEFLSKKQDAMERQYSKDDMDKYYKMLEYCRNYRKFTDKGKVDVGAPKKFDDLEAYHINELAKSGQLQKFLTEREAKAKQAGTDQVLDVVDNRQHKAQTLPPGQNTLDTVKQESTDNAEAKIRQIVTSWNGKTPEQIVENPAEVQEYIKLMDSIGHGAAVPKKWRELTKT